MKTLLLLMAFSGTLLAGDWVNLLEGKLDSHWTTKGNWKLESDGSVSLKPREGEKGWSRFDAYLWSKKEYTDFDVEFEYKVEKNGNSGFYFHVGDAANPVNKGIEVQIFDATEKLTDHTSGGVIPGIAPKKSTGKAGEWNKMLVVVKGDKLTVTLNGEVVNEVNLNEGKLKDRPKTGLIGFQDHGLPLALRNIKVRDTK